MNESDSAVVSAPDASPPSPRSNRVDLSNRPSPEWLDTVQAELNDTDLVLKCLARDSAKICQTCDAARAAGELESRPMLARCAGTKLPR